MLNWLPAMNHCSVDEEETTKAVFALKCDLPAKKHKSKKKEKNKVSEHGSGGGDAKTSKMKGKRSSDQDSLREKKARASMSGGSPSRYSDGEDKGQSDNSGGHRTRDVDAPSPMRKDSSSQAATNALKEAKDLKHLADRLKNSGSNEESTALYFQAALKFLHSASLLESCHNEGTKQGEMIQSMQIFSSTAKLCEFCAHEYERLHDMAAASLAYKCTEVAYMRVIYTSHANASRDRRELQTTLQMVPPGESPFSSASDVENLNNPTTADKVSFPKGVSSPQVAGNHVISARNRPNFVRLLNFAQDFKRHEAEYYSLQSQLTFMYPKHVFVRVFCNLDVDRLIKLCSCMNWEVVYGSIATVLLL
ncbi:hypothetical protein V6N13_079285 [Hibiscus sabdariffa]